MPADRAYVLGVPVDPASVDEVMRRAREAVNTGTPVRAVTVNAEYVVRAQTDLQFADVIKTADVATADGSGVLWALRRQGIVMGERVGGSDLIWSLSEQARRLGHRVFLLGGGECVAERAAARLQRTYPGLLIAGTYAGSAAPDDEGAIVDLVCRSRADILFVAFGAPRQDLWIQRNLGRTGARFAIGVGGSFDYLAGGAQRAPIWMRQRGIEWLWRLVRQPWRWRRMLALPRFVWLVLTVGKGTVRMERKDR